VSKKRKTRGNTDMNDFLGNNRMIDTTRSDPSVMDYHYKIQKYLNSKGYGTDLNGNGETIEVQKDGRHVGTICGLTGSYVGTVALRECFADFFIIRIGIPFVVAKEREKKRIKENDYLNSLRKQRRINDTERT
jgi:hypothetical protein